MLPTDLRITSDLLWRSALAVAVFDAAYVLLLMRRVRPATFRALGVHVSVVGVLFFGGVWLVMAAVFWEAVYSYVFPAGARWLLPLGMGALNGAAVGLAWRLAARSPNPALRYCLLGGLWGVLTHLWAVARGIVAQPPMLQGAQPAAAVVFAGFEFALYWCLILTAAWLWRRVGLWLQRAVGVGV